MLQQAWDFRDESEALYRLLSPLPDSEYREATQFKGWTLDDVLRHLHVWNRAAETALTNEAAFLDYMARVQAARTGLGMRGFEREQCQGLSGRPLLELWRTGFLEVAGQFAGADPKRRVKWAGPDMSVRSSITARLMETWAHGQEVYDHLGVIRNDTDAIQNIVVLGINTYGWTFAVRKQSAPEPTPHVRLTAPSGAIWEYHEPQAHNCVVGSATEFCQVVTQVRNIADTQLQVVGEPARQWMTQAQCFAGAAETPPAPGSRFTRKINRGV